MIAMRTKVRAIGIRRTARAAEVEPVDVRHYINRRYNKISKSSRKRIRLHLISTGVLPAPKPRQKHVCPLCDSVHVIRKQFNISQSTMQFQTADNISASK
jgi:hypothetical protein